jgi:hypothetical protein
MHGSLFALHNLFLCADFRPEPITKKDMPVSLLLALTCHLQHSQHHHLGNDFSLLFILVTCYVFNDA